MSVLLVVLLATGLVVWSAVRAGAGPLVDPPDVALSQRVSRSFRFALGGAEFAVGWLYLLLTVAFIVGGVQDTGGRVADCGRDMSHTGYFYVILGFVTPAAFGLGYVGWLRLRRGHVILAQVLVLIALIVVAAPAEAGCR